MMLISRNICEGIINELVKRTVTKVRIPFASRPIHKSEESMPRLGFEPRSPGIQVRADTAIANPLGEAGKNVMFLDKAQFST